MVWPQTVNVGYTALIVNCNNPKNFALWCPNNTFVCRIRSINNTTGEFQMYTIMGYTVSTKEQAESVLMVALLKGDKVAAEQARAVIKKLS